MIYRRQPLPFEEPMNEPTLLEALAETLQAELELEMKEAGVARFRATMSNISGGHEASGAVGQRLIAGTLRTASAAIVKARDEALAGRPQHRALAVDIIKDFDPDGLALLTGRALVDGYGASRNLTAVARSLGSMVEEETRLARFEEANPGAYEWTMRRIKETTGSHHKLSTTRHLMRLKGIPWEPWGQRQQIIVGLWLLDQFNGATGMFTLDQAVQTDSNGKSTTKKAYVLHPKPETVTWMEEAAKRLEFGATEHWPMIAKPKPWSKPWGGGYLTKLVPTLPLVKMRRDQAGKDYLTKLKQTDLSFVYEAINAVQDTAWRINPQVLTVLDEIEARGIDVEGLAPGKDRDIPPHPLGAGEIDRTNPVHKSWCKQVSILHRLNRNSRGKRVQLTRTLLMARRFKDYPAIYFPHTMDFRGRIYPVPAFLNPQGADFQKALLTFAEGKPIETQEQLEWLAVHGANSYGVDKVPFGDRFNWCVDNEAAIRQVAADPLGDGFKFWSAADAPFCFLAWCFEFVKVLDGGWGTVSSLPVALDGSCNGLQHYSAALRDPIGGAAVNLTPGDRPRDIYGLVAERVLATLRTLKDDSGEVGDFSRKWLEFGINRKVTKRSVMTLPYGCSVYSVREFIEDAMKEAIQGGKVNPFAYLDEKGDRRDGLFDGSKFLQSYVWEAIGDTVVAAREGMGWLQQVAKSCARTAVPIYWTTTDGFPVQQAYPSFKERQVETRFHGKLFKPVIHEATDAVDRNRQRNGIAPNWVHSQDGAALRMYVRLAKANGVTSFALVHDSYGAPAADIPVVNWAIREAFVQMYGDSNELQAFRDEVVPKLPTDEAVEVPEVPAFGSLDVALVRGADYFFA